MKHLFLTLVLLSFTKVSFANNEDFRENKSNEEKSINPPSAKYEFDSKINLNKIKQKFVQMDLVKECEVHIDTTTADGTKIQGTMTFVDVSWWTCSKMQLAAWYDRNF